MSMIELVWVELNQKIREVRTDVRRAQRVERAEISDSIPAYLVSELPTLVDGGLGLGDSYVTLAFASNGRKSGEGAGLGTGQLVYYNAPTNQWLRVRDDSVITA